MSSLRADEVFGLEPVFVVGDLGSFRSEFFADGPSLSSTTVSCSSCVRVFLLRREVS